MTKDRFKKLHQQTNSITLVLGILIFAVSTISINNLFLAYAWQENITETGAFNYTQTDESGSPEWINTGNWSLVETKPVVFTFDAIIDMVKPDGSEDHKHKVSDLTISYAPINRNNSTIIDGKTTITMRENTVLDEPTSITLNKKVISVYFDPVKIDNHFRNQSITGSILK